MYNVRIIASSLVCFGLLGLFGLFIHVTQAVNVSSFKDTISSSRPGALSNHTMRFTLGADMPAGAYFDFTPPPGFSVVSTAFGFRNVEMFVNGAPRLSSDTLAAGIDQVTITPGSPGSIRYTLNPAGGLSEGDTIELRIGNHTSTSVNVASTTFDGFSTTTIPADTPGIENSADTGMHKFNMVGVGGVEPISTNFIIFLTSPVGLGPGDTTEEIPPFRFGGSPTSTFSGVSLFVEISLQTDEFAECKYSTVPGVDYYSMPVAFNSSGLVVHTRVVGVTPNTTFTFYVRCIDDEGNFNTDDYLISFAITATPTGDPNAEGDNEGDGTGTGDEGDDDGDNDGENDGDTDGDGDPVDDDEGGGGSGGGGGGGGGGRGSGGEPGGGFENTGPYESGDGLVLISGAAFPGSEVYVLVDGKIAEQQRTGANGTFSIELEEIARGAYTFGIYAIDRTGVRSSTYSTSFTVSGARASALSNISLPPSIKVTPDPVPNGGTATFTGYAQPNATIAIESRLENNNGTLKTLTATADANGLWSATLPTAGFAQGTYQVRAKATPIGVSATSFSNWTVFGVGQAAVVRTNADLNRDGKVNLTDFSILLFWWGTNGGNSNPPADINSDGNVSLTDFSILLFNWTG